MRSAYTHAFAVARLYRLGTCAGGVFLAGLGILLLEETPPARSGFVVAAVFASIAFANSLNDCLDYRLDVAAGAPRPIALRQISHGSARAWTVTAAAGSIVLAGLGTHRLLAYVIVLNALSAIYDFWLKRIVLVGNVCVAALSSSAVMSGSIAFNFAPSLALNVAIAIFPFLLGFEILKDVRDGAVDARFEIPTIGNVMVPARAALLGMMIAGSTPVICIVFAIDDPSWVPFLVAYSIFYIMGARDMRRWSGRSDPNAIPIGKLKLVWRWCPLLLLFLV